MNLLILIMLLILRAECCLRLEDIILRAECIDDFLGLSYRGRKQYTKSGKLCQRWDSQVPHQHRFTTSNCNNCEENYCRNPDFEAGPWCYTTDPGTRWELCNIPFCKPSIETKVCCDQTCMNSIQCETSQYVCTYSPYSANCLSKKTDSLGDTYSEKNLPTIAVCIIGVVVGFIGIMAICCLYCACKN